MLVSKGVDISNDSSVPQVQEGIVNYGAVRGRGVEDDKVSVARGRTIEVCMGKGASVERGSISRGELGTFSLQCNTIPDRMVPDEFCDFFLSILIDENEGVMTRVVGIVLMPPFPRMDDIFVVADRDV